MVRWALSRLIGQMAMWCAAMADREYDFAVERHESVASMRRRLATTGPDFVTQVREVADEGSFDETLVDAFAPEPVVMTYGAMVAQCSPSPPTTGLAVSKLRDFGITDLGWGDPKPWMTERWAKWVKPGARRRPEFEP